MSAHPRGIDLNPDSIDEQPAEPQFLVPLRVLCHVR